MRYQRCSVCEELTHPTRLSTLLGRCFDCIDAGRVVRQAEKTKKD